MKKIRNSLFFLVLFSGELSAIASQVRVRILSKHRPSEVMVRSNDTVRRFSLSSELPVSILTESFHLQIPGRPVDRQYYGDLHIYRSSDKKELILVNQVDLEKYVSSVVVSEMGFQKTEAMKAQAVLARTWVKKNLRTEEIYDFDDLTNSQVYKGKSEWSEKVYKILAGEKNYLIRYGDRPIEVLYHAECADRTFSAKEVWGKSGYEYLIAKPLPEAIRKGREVRRWQKRIAKTELDEIFSLAKESGAYSVSQMDGQWGVGKGSFWVGIDDFRLQVNRKLGWNTLLSNSFSISGDKEVVFVGYGFGHLVGFCQKEAVAMAGLGWSFQKILEFFFPGTRLGL